MVKNPLAKTGASRDTGLIRGLGRSPGEGNGNPFQYFHEESPWTKEIVGVHKESTEHRCVHAHTHTHTHTNKYSHIGN